MDRFPALSAARKAKKENTIAPAVPMDRLLSKIKLRELLGIGRTVLNEILDEYKVPSAKMPGGRHPKYRLGDVLYVLGVGLSPDIRADHFRAEAELHNKEEEKYKVIFPH